jgi:hypothetical protein
MHGLIAPHTWRLPFERKWRGPHAAATALAGGT